MDRDPYYATIFGAFAVVAAIILLVIAYAIGIAVFP